MIREVIGEILSINFVDDEVLKKLLFIKQKSRSAVSQTKLKEGNRSCLLKYRDSNFSDVWECIGFKTSILSHNHNLLEQCKNTQLLYDLGDCIMRLGIFQDLIFLFPMFFFLDMFDIQLYLNKHASRLCKVLRRMIVIRKCQFQNITIT